MSDPATLSKAPRPFSIFRHGGFTIGGGVLLLLVLIAIFAPLLAPHDPFLQSLSDRLKPPFWQEGTSPGHWLGTDQLGRDYLSRLIYGTQISLVIGFGAVLISGFIGISLGVAAGYFGGWVDTCINAVITTRLSLPVVLVALAIVAVVGGSLTVVLLVIGLLLWDQFAVVARTATQQLRNAEYVSAARAMGTTHMHVMVREILPNIRASLIVVATVEMANAVLIEAALSFLGLGVQAPLPSWGLMLSEGKNFMFFNPWLITLPGLCLFVMALSINLLGDGLRDIQGSKR
ncbi:ABC-type dipeptide/oligopeptide/nickel transport system, permease component [Hoeflea sp. IMCC20628]|uniref:ABC transporter permease n=1 Tax=Hoeflea sp. IMCC20628 TaxID=1620421 RepID=UPI00063AB52A|nr:ABC transporter permease [Hoeflea sp. IMCC20628]AKI01867.1 ABC-type dipeptide/oligopeptide/nickel transport system, permease component [Hoeflea sp. IMCC20628]